MALTIALISSATFAGEPSCSLRGESEEFRYTWRLKGGARFVAGLVFPTTGVGNLKTTFPASGESSVRSELLITAPNGRQGGFYSYESDIDTRRSRTLLTAHGYSWGSKSRQERTVIDYAKGQARLEKKTRSGVEALVKKLPDGDAQLRDVLTAIWFLRHQSHSINGPLLTSIYSNGKEYPVVFRPIQRRSFDIGGRATPVRGFEIVDAPGGKKWPGGVKVWVSDDDRRIPVRIEIDQGLGAVQLDLQSVEACTLMARL